MDKFKKYPYFNKKGELIGTIELDNVYCSGEHSSDLLLLAYDLKNNPYEVSAWTTNRIINFSDASKPRMYGKE
jgi:hypothetical protein